MKPGQSKTLEPLKIDAPGSTVSSRSDRGPNAVPQDTTGGNLQGIRTVVPPQYQNRYEAFRSSISGQTPRKTAPPK